MPPKAATSRRPAPSAARSYRDESMQKRTLVAGLAGALLGLLPQAHADSARPAALAADIRWTAYGVPHIRATDEGGLGFGVGYAYARDNACLLADEIVTARGERSRYFGAEGESSAQVGNLASDVFFTWLNRPESVEAFRKAQSAEVTQLLEGYAAGFNRFLREASTDTTSCLGQPWLKPIDSSDLVRLTRRLLVEGGVGQFAQAVVAAAPPGAASAALTGAEGFRLAEQRRERFRLERGSNAIAVGAERSASGHALLLANPHFPWQGAMRFYQLHLSIPGKLDVMGAALPGLPMVNIGFNRHLAWTHTVDTSSHFTLYRLELDPQNPLHYRLDGRWQPLEKRVVKVRVRGADGQLQTVEHNVYESVYGPVLVWPGKLDWSAGEAYALRDANLDNTRVLQQWYSINQARDVADLRHRVESLQGIPWVNTLAADEHGDVLYLNQSVVPNLTPGQLQACAIPALVAEGLPALQGNLGRCGWSRDPGAAQPGIQPATQLPALVRRDFVQNSNDSAWMTNPAAPLEGFSPLASRQDQPLGLRARFALQALQGKGAIDEPLLQRLVTGNHVYAADLVLPDLLQLCRQAQEAALSSACGSLAKWDRSANLDAGPGFVYFQRFMSHFDALEGAWKVPFDPVRPLQTPSGIALDKPQVAKQVREALLAATKEVHELGLDQRQRWGEVQVSSTAKPPIPIPGGDGHLGIYNAMQSVPHGDHLEVVSGSSYIQLVSFTAEGPQAKGLLAFSQASEPRSPHHADQTRLFSRQAWSPLPFTEAQIDADPTLRVVRLAQ